jgi:hypothetical protein
LRFANDAALHGSRLVAVDIPDRRLELVDRFPGRAAYLLQSFHRSGDLFGRTISRRVRLRLARGTSLVMTLNARVPASRAATAYIKADDEAPVFGTSGHGLIHQSQLVGPDTFSLSSRPTVVAVGIVLNNPATAPAQTLTGDWYECRFQARARSGNRLELLTPCDGWHHYAFPNGATATAREDVTNVLNVAVRSR